ncbi:MAG: AbrB/MazE/SpoVT family DNA-binding domain-containing protein [Burkholderiaceae bacterium]
MTTVKITTIGNSLGIVLPREVLQRLRVDKGDVLFLVETRGGVELVPHEPELVAQVEALERTARAERDVLLGLAARATLAQASGASEPPRAGSSPAKMHENPAAGLRLTDIGDV